MPRSCKRKELISAKDSQTITTASGQTKCEHRTTGSMKVSNFTCMHACKQALPKKQAFIYKTANQDTKCCIT